MLVVVCIESFNSTCTCIMKNTIQILRYSTAAMHSQRNPPLSGHLFFGVLRIQQKGIQPSDWLKLKKSVPGFAFDLCLPAMDKSVSEPPNMKPYPLPTRFEYKRIGLTTCSSEGNCKLSNYLVELGKMR